ncbi:MAG: hypothetical protein WD844_13820 [Thermoleophilaceae bacterium]
MSTLRLPRLQHHRHGSGHPRLRTLSRLFWAGAVSLILLFAFFAAEAF